MQYKVIRNKTRKRLRIEVDCGEIIVRAPMETSDEEIKAFALRYEQWALEAFEKQKREREKRRSDAENADSRIMDEIQKLIGKRPEIIYCERKNLSMNLTPDRLQVRAPYGTTEGEIYLFLDQNRNWIANTYAKYDKTTAEVANTGHMTLAQQSQAIAQARKVIPERVRYYAPLVGVTYGSITIRNQKTKWGSCSSKGNLNFNWLLILAPPEVLDSVVVHELCHRKVFDHSQRFYAEVLRVFPEYWKWDQWLKENTRALNLRAYGIAGQAISGSDDTDDDLEQEPAGVPQPSDGDPSEQLRACFDRIVNSASGSGGCRDTELLGILRDMDLTGEQYRQLIDMLSEAGAIDRKNTPPIKNEADQPRIPEAAEPGISVNAGNNLYEFFKENGLEVIDKRANSGALWVVGEPEKLKPYLEIAKERFNASGSFTANGRAAGRRMAWFTKCNS